MTPVEFHQQGLEAANKAAKVADQLYWFRIRRHTDARNTKVDQETGELSHIPGFKTNHPNYQSLFSGTEEEKEKGFLMGDRIRSYSEGCAVHPLLNPAGPSKMAYDWQQKELGCTHATHIFIVKSLHSECALFCFPLVGEGDIHLMASIGARYGESHCFFFSGNLEEYATERARGPRGHEFASYLADKANFPKFFSVPMVEFQGLELSDVPSVAQRLKRTPDGTGAFWLNPNS